MLKFIKKYKTINRYIIGEYFWYLKNELRIFFVKIKNIFIKTEFPRNLKICISTVKGNSQETIPILLRNLKSNGVPLEKVYIFEGGNNKNQKDASRLNYYYVDHNSFDLTGFIGILDFEIEGEYWLLLHDTLEVLPTFVRNLNRINYSDFDTVQLKKSPSMNIGFYSMDFLRKQSDYIYSNQNKDYSNEALQKIKNRLIGEEDKLFSLSTSKLILDNRMIYFNNSTYLKKFKRRKEIFYYFGLIKYKANYTRKKEYELTL